MNLRYHISQDIPLPTYLKNILVLLLGFLRRQYMRTGSFSLFFGSIISNNKRHELLFLASFQITLPARERAIVDDRIFAVTRANHIHENHWNQLFGSINAKQKSFLSPIQKFLVFSSRYKRQDIAFALAFATLLNKMKGLL